MSQLALPLAWPADPSDDAFLVGPSNERAVRVLERWASWPVRTGLLVGPRRSGRSLLARLFARNSGGVVIDGAQRQPETALFHAWNRAEAANRPLLLVVEELPPAWGIELPDLRSRVAASPVAEIGPPDDALVRALLERELARRGLDARPDLLEWIAARIERSHAAVLGAVDALDARAMERRRGLSIPFARDTLTEAGLLGQPTPEDR
ncbi:HdaA/DnaA family protein [Sphingomonas lenta]|uniref:Chromosomal replication initiator DnaA n=1 Tax=Sphingomonas lenta TaxID=1141887 RepID=A0A2A2SKI7_9SPHN|nr:DnaA/Hda family protein [Sphingomonas lenta]PAX09739.1 chromosomal replication initiator DnaA [Sphingomonas lenta]